MSVEVIIPDVAESITEVAIAQWLKKSGELVQQDEPIVEVETDKASQELFAPATGILEVLVQEDETVAVGAVIAKIEPTDAANSSPSSSEPETPVASEPETPASENPKPPNPSGQVVEMKVTPFAESITEVVIGEWLKEDGDYVEMDEPVCEVETDKATQELPAEASGILRIVAEAGATLSIGDLICKIEVSDKPSSGSNQDSGASTSSSTGSTPAVSGNDTYATGHPSPAASKILSEKGINPSEVQGTGVDGRITKEDALKAQKVEKTTTSSPSSPSEASTPSLPSKGGSREMTRKRMSQLRKTIARRLVSVKNETAMLTTFNEANMKPIMDLRKKYKETFKEKYGVSLGFMSFFGKACAQALLEFPEVNAMIDGNEMVYHNYVDISVAVSTERGLVVPVLRNVETLSFAEIELGIANLAKRARDNKLSIEEMQGGTFTITNGGIYGSMMSTPIINAPQSAILGMHNIVQRPYVVDGEIKILPMMYLALSYDHRIIDGKEAVSYLVAVKKYLEEPERLLFGV